MKQITFLSLNLLLLLALQACNSINTRDNSKTTQKPINESIEIVGKSVTLTFPNFTVIDSIISDTTLHWKHISKNGIVNEGDELINYKEINDNCFFINWIEKTGLTVSMILDSKNGTATSFVSYADEKSQRGKRSASFNEGFLKINE